MNQTKQFKVLGQRLRELGFDSYEDYLASPHWKALRVKFFRKHRVPPCSGCWRTHTALQLHHRHYKRLGHERMTDLVALCPDCHKQTHVFCSINRKVNFSTAHREARNRAYFLN